MTKNLHALQRSSRIIGEGEVHIWSAGLQQPGKIIGQFMRELSTDEVNRANRFSFKQDQNRFLCARGILRRILSAYTGVEPEALLFAYGMHGKPFLKHDASFQFNLSHTGDVAIYAMVRGQAVGVDIERIRPIKELDAIISHIFTEREAQEVNSLSFEEKTKAFFQVWTRKEAWQKCTGEGIATGSKSLPNDVFLLSFEPVAGYAACVAARSPLTPLFFEWEY
jgi:4'-phosphopantetheinyl transferase